MSIVRSLVPFALAVLVSACGSASTTTATTTPARTSDASERRAAPASTASASSSGGEGGCSLESIYFTYDSNTLDGRARETLAADAACLRARPTDSVTLVGGADERGTEEYNLSLGDRRARAVRGYLTDSGVAPERMSVHTMGEEWASGTDEPSMSRDRRVDPRPASGR